uniref:WW domain-containing protein n=1 Tax=Globisporangium ultimum (strain ATCC 200006 / CBS 805.95 / DAOM BR144) TaxID=431595 RepID=K3WG43_GLOUD
MAVVMGANGANDGAADETLFRLNALHTAGEWTVHDDDQGHLFYYNLATHESQWTSPPEFTGLEGELMMKLMLQHAVARSGFWSAHDAGNGTLYYFNERTRASVWERPEEWGVVPPPPPPPPEVEEAEKEEAAPTKPEGTAEHKEEEEAAEDRPKRDKKAKKSKKKKSKTAEVDDKPADGGEKIEAQEEELPVQSLTEEEQEAAKRKEEEERKRIESFRQMLRDKKIMPFTKWSVAMPRILSDPRFMAVPTMDERRAIFEHFVQHRRDDLKAEKKAKLSDVKKVFTELLRELFAKQIEEGSWDGKTSLPVFLATLEDAIDAARYKQLQDDAMALLPTTVQEKVYEKTLSEYKKKADKVEAEERALSTFLEQKMSSSKQDAIAWGSDEAQQLLVSFYESKEGDDKTPLLSSERQRHVFRHVRNALHPPVDVSIAKYGGGHSGGRAEHKHRHLRVLRRLAHVLIPIAVHDRVLRTVRVHDLAVERRLAGTWQSQSPWPALRIAPLTFFLVIV